MLTLPKVDKWDGEVSVDAQMEESGPEPEDDDEVQDLPITLADGESDSYSGDPENYMDRESERHRYLSLEDQCREIMRLGSAPAIFDWVTESPQGIIRRIVDSVDPDSAPVIDGFSQAGQGPQPFLSFLYFTYRVPSK
jgi:hypothetical protein